MGVDPGSHIFTKVDIHPEKWYPRGDAKFEIFIIFFR